MPSCRSSRNKSQGRFFEDYIWTGQLPAQQHLGFTGKLSLSSSNFDQHLLQTQMWRHMHFSDKSFISLKKKSPQEFWNQAGFCKVPKKKKKEVARLCSSHQTPLKIPAGDKDTRSQRPGCCLQTNLAAWALDPWLQWYHLWSISGDFIPAGQQELIWNPPQPGSWWAI